MIEKLKHKIAILLGYKNKDNNSNWARTFEIFIETLVIVNVAAVIVESYDNIYTQYHLLLSAFEIFTVTVFSIEFLLRIWTSDIFYPTASRWESSKKYLLSTNAIIDFLAILPFFIPYIIKLDLRHLRIFRLVRLMRVFKLSKYSHSMILIEKIIIEKKQELLATLLLMFSMLVFASTIMFYIEKEVQPEAFPNILYAFWWGIITLTTIGYGDVYPITGLGKVIGGLVAILGVLIIAIPTGIISSSFVQKMEESNYLKRMEEIKKKLREAFYKKYIPVLDCYVRRGQLSMDAVKLHLELSENDVYKIAEGKNEFRFRNKKIIQNGLLTDKLFLEYREINKSYGTYKNRDHNLTLISPESLLKPSIGYFVYCISEKLECNYISNEFFGDDSTTLEESFGDSGLEPSTTFSFTENMAYFEKTHGSIPPDFEEWKNDLIKVRKENSIYIVFNTLVQGLDKNLFARISSFKANNNEITASNNSIKSDKIEKFRISILKKAEEKFEEKFEIQENAKFNNITENNIVKFITQVIKSDTVFISISEDYIINEKLFSTAAIIADTIKKELF